MIKTARIIAMPVMIIMILHLVFCTRSSVTGVETTNGNSILAVLENGAPAPDAKVRFVADTDWYHRLLTSQNIVIDSTLTDSTGRFNFPLNINSATIEVEAGEQRGLRFSFQKNNKNPDTIRCSSGGNITGNVKSSNSILRIAGTSYRTLTNEAGAFQFANLPPCSLSSIIESKNPGGGLDLFFISSNAVKPQSTTNLGSIDYSDTLPLSYFNRQWKSTPIAPITHGGNWYVFDDAQTGGSSSISESFVKRDSGQALRIDATLSTAIPHPYSGIGVHITGVGKYIDLSALKEIAFYARGNAGSIEVNVNTYASQSSGRDWDRFRFTLEITEDWQEYIVPVDSLKTLLLKSVWIEASQMSNAINFVKSQPVDSTFPKSYYLELDQVRLVGIRIDQLMSKY